jgi:hypothetical protein
MFGYRSLCVLILALATFLAPSAREPQSANPAEAHLTEARATLEKGDGAKALDAARLGLEYERNSIELLDLASRAALAADDKDAAIWYASLALDVAGDAAEHAALIEELTTRIAGLDPLESVGVQLIGDYVAQLFELGKLCGRRKLAVNAVDLFGRCKGTRFEQRALEQLDRIYGNKKATEALVASGIDVPLAVKRKLSPKKIAKGDRDHAEWENAWEIKG